MVTVRGVLLGFCSSTQIWLVAPATGTLGTKLISGSSQGGITPTGRFTIGTSSLRIPPTRRIPSQACTSIWQPLPRVEAPEGGVTVNVVVRISPGVIPVNVDGATTAVQPAQELSTTMVMVVVDAESLRTLKVSGLAIPGWRSSITSRLCWVMTGLGKLVPVTRI